MLRVDPSRELSFLCKELVSQLSQSNHYRRTADVPEPSLFTCGVNPCKAATPWWKRFRTSAGATQMAPLAITRKYGPRLESASHRDPGVNEATASTITVTINTPRTSPKAPPNRRSNQRKPAFFNSQRAIPPRMPAASTTTRKTAKNAATSATQVALT